MKNAFLFCVKVLFIVPFICYTDGVKREVKTGMDRSLYSLESRFLFLESASKRMYEKETMTALYALISSSENKDETARMLAELMRDISDDELLLKRANERLTK